jgi:Sec-independent protein translocase protein TatA
MFDMTRGEIILVCVIFALVYASSFLPKLAQKLAAPKEGSGRS